MSNPTLDGLHPLVRAVVEAALKQAATAAASDAAIERCSDTDSTEWWDAHWNHKQACSDTTSMASALAAAMEEESDAT